MTSESETTPSTFLSDRPITHAGEDRLDVAPFVHRLVGPILHAPEGGGFVLGIYGPWGSGKSSALTLLEAALEDVNELEGPDADGKPYTVVVRFTPWLYGSAETLLPAFFDTLAAAVGRMSGAPRKKRNRLKGAIELMGEIVIPLVQVGGHLLGGPLAGELTKQLAALVQGAAKGTAGSMATTAADYDESKFRRQRDTAAKLLREMKAGLRPVRVVMTIDDLDRATGVEEVVAMLKLVKLIADLPNVVYVIAMDRAHVEDLLCAHVSERFGLEFLDKIVQVGLTVPAAEPERLSRWLLDEATAIATRASLDASSLAVDWDDSLARYLPSASFERVVRAVLRTPRDVVRILSVYRFAAFGGDSAQPLHALDLLLLSILQVIDPRVYDAIRLSGRFLLHEDKTLIVDFANDGRGRAANAARREARLDAIARGLVSASTVRSATDDVDAAGDRGAENPAAAPPKTTIRTIIERLFPHAITPRSEGRDPREARREEQVENDTYRIASPERFATYFRFAPPPHAAPPRLVNDMFALMLGHDQQHAAAPGEQTGVATEVTAESPTWVSRFDDVCATVSTEMRESLLDQIGNRMANVSRDAARELATRIPDLASHSQSGISEHTARWAAHVVDTLVTYRAGGRGERTTEDMIEQDTRAAAAFLVAMVKSYASQDLVLAMKYADSISDSRSYPATCPSSESQQEVTALGLELGLRLVQQTNDVFASFGAYAGGSALWTYQRLLARAGAVANGERHSPLERYLTELVSREPSRVGDLLACAASWSMDHSIPSISRRHLAECRDAIARLVDLMWFDNAVRDATEEQMNAESERVPQATLSYPALVLRYRMMIDEDRANSRQEIPLELSEDDSATATA